MWKFFQSLFSGSIRAFRRFFKSWGEDKGFKSEQPVIQLRSEYDHLVFFQQGDHNTANLIRKRTPDSATIIAMYCCSRWKR